MYKYKCLNNISKVINKVFNEDYVQVDDIDAADAVLVRSAKMNDMELPDKLLAISRAGTGVNNIPLDKCAEKGIVVFNAPGANANSDIAKNMEKAKKAYVGKEIKGKKLGVIGLGAIGGMVANAANKLGMDVYGVDPYLSVHNALVLSHNVKVLKTYDEIFKKCDYITMHMHLTDKTRGSIGKAAFDSMKKGVVVLNFSRGEIVDNEALIEAIKSGKVAKYVTDFPTPDITNIPNVIATPHLGASTGEAEENCAEMAAAEIRDYLESGYIRNSVNMPDCDPGYCDSTARIAIIHRNKPNMLSKFTQIIADDDINIAHLTNTSRGDYAYCVLDIDSEITDKIVEKLSWVDDVIRVRVIK